jgi:hypothetical protein
MPDSESQTEDALVLGSLEPDQLVSAKHRLGRQHLGGMTRVLMWGLRLYVVVAFIVVADKIWKVLLGY